MKSNKNNRGFTLVELLAVVVIFGIIATIAIAGIRGVLKRSKESYLDAQLKMVILAGQSYYADHRSHLPKVIGPIHEVDLETLVALKYIDPVKDANGVDCVTENGTNKSKVMVQKVNDKEYKYRGYLYCSGKTSGTLDNEKPVITLSPMKTDRVESRAVTVMLKVVDNEEVLSYRYIIYKDGKEYRDTGYQTYKKEVAIRLTETGVFQIKAYAYDTSGNASNITSLDYKIDIPKPECNHIFVDAAGVSEKTWQKNNVKITVSNRDSNIESWTLKDVISDNGASIATTRVLVKRTTSNERDFVLSLNGQHKLVIEAYNKAGESCTREVGTYYIDKEPPRILKIENPTNGAETSKPFSLKLTGEDLHSGIDYWQYRYNGTEWRTYADSSKNTFETTPFSAIRDEKVYIRACDKVGNCSSGSDSTHIHIVPPPPSVSLSQGHSFGYWLCATCRTSCHSSRVQSGGTCMLDKNGKYGNVMIKIDFSYNSNTASFHWEIIQGNQTFIGVKYFVGIRVIKDGISISDQRIKHESSSWGTSSHNSGTITVNNLGPGVYRVETYGNSQEPNFGIYYGDFTIN